MFKSKYIHEMDEISDTRDTDEESDNLKIVIDCIQEYKLSSKDKKKLIEYLNNN